METSKEPARAPRRQAGWKGRPTVPRAIETEGLTKYYGGDARHRRSRPGGGGGRGVRLHRPERGGQDHHHPPVAELPPVPPGVPGAIFGMDIARRVAGDPRPGRDTCRATWPLYPSMTGREFLLYFSRLRGIETAAETERLAERFELDLDRRIKEYSKGNRQKVGVVNAFMHEPELLILDEPTSGLDPLMQQEFAELVAEVRADGRTVFLSSHYLPEVERVADRVAIVRRSRLIDVDTLAGFRSKVQSNLSIKFGAPVDPAPFAALEGVTVVDLRDGRTMLQLSIAGSQKAVIEEAAARDVVTVTSEEADLDEVFLSYYGSGAVPATRRSESMLPAVLGKALRDRRRAVMGYGLGIVALSIWLGLMFGVMRESDDFVEFMNDLPDQMLSAFGIDTATFHHRGRLLLLLPVLALRSPVRPALHHQRDHRRDPGRGAGRPDGHGALGAGVPDPRRSWKRPEASCPWPRWSWWPSWRPLSWSSTRSSICLSP